LKYSKKQCFLIRSEQQVPDNSDNSFSEVRSSFL